MSQGLAGCVQALYGRGWSSITAITTDGNSVGSIAASTKILSREIAAGSEINNIENVG
jgi:hypothetical protein